MPHFQTLKSSESPVLPPIILASTSIFRQQLLKKLHLPFSTDKPQVDEARQPNESIEAMVQRLSQAKAEAVSQKNPNHIIIGSDQSAAFEGESLGKPHTFERALEQLCAMQGKIVTFYTGLHVINTAENKAFSAMDITHVHFRTHSKEALIRYLEIEQPFECAGSFKSEGLGITLFEAVETKDPNALIGLPLIELTSIFEKMGFELPL